MNNHVIEVAKLTGLYDENNPENFQELAEHLKMFACLIVEECRDILDEVYRETPLESCGYFLRLDEKIAQHFYGIESNDEE